MREVLSVLRRKATQVRVGWHTGRGAYHRMEAAHWQAVIAGRALADADAAGCTCGEWRQSACAPHWWSCPLAGARA
jgi:hypothetical protein